MIFKEQLFIADTLPDFYPEFYSIFEQCLADARIDFQLLPGTKDVWLRDYMPVEIPDGSFVQFRFQPDYLKTWPQYKTDTKSLLKTLEISVRHSDIIADGGNLVRQGNTVLLCDKIFRENDCHTREAKNHLLSQLEEQLQCDKIIILPTHPLDICGHADGLVRFFAEDAVLIQEMHSRDDIAFQKKLRQVLKQSGIAYETLPVHFPDVAKQHSIRGQYLNFLQIGDVLFVPVYNLPEDESACQKIEQYINAPGLKIVPVLSNDIAEDGGALHCISWTLKNFHTMSKIIPLSQDYRKSVAYQFMLREQGRKLKDWVLQCNEMMFDLSIHGYWKSWSDRQPVGAVFHVTPDMYANSEDHLVASLFELQQELQKHLDKNEALTDPLNYDALY